MAKADTIVAAGRGDANPDPEKQSITEASTHELKREMSGRHLQFIAIGGAVGTGLFIGSGASLATAGPVGCLISYIAVGTILYSVMTSLGEMATYIPTAGSFTSYSARFVDPALGFAMGWLYWFSWAITWALELTAAGLIVQYWNSSLNIGIWIAVFWVVFTAVNFVPVKLYGEMEYWFVSIKVVTILGFLIFAICINAGASPQGYLGFTYWKNPGAFASYNENMVPATGKFVSFWSVLVTAAFSYQGAELVGVGAGEARNPHKTVPIAIRNTFWGILFLFVSTIFFLGILVPYDNPELTNGSTSAAGSPLVIAANLASVPVLPDIINAVLLTAVLSAANSVVYSGSRILVGLANEGHAPRFLTKTNGHGVPYNAVAFTSAFGLLAFLNLSPSGTDAFNWFLNITAVAGLITWASINLSHIQFQRAMKAQNIPRHLLPYLAPLQPYLAWYGLFFNTLIVITQGFTAFMPWNTVDFFTAYISVILFVVLYVGYKAAYRPAFVKVSEADLHKGRLQTAEGVVIEQ
ncbi:amino acid permease [Diaporthe eres]|uniref:Amino acid permease/ SLC12A domain-containing protein n=1 Tax=Diaporthe vaccinii TaxID=105482 RepID=A0ABR4F5Q9_9PEZI|nr:amino acid permease [Diaporthe eres]